MVVRLAAPRVPNEMEIMALHETFDELQTQLLAERAGS